MTKSNYPTKNASRTIFYFFKLSQKLEHLLTTNLIHFTGDLLSPPSSAPCPPTGLKVRMQKSDQTHWALTTWDSVNCSNVQYLVEVTGRIQNNPQALMDFSSYWWSREYFEFPMPCSTAYNITVRSRNSAGISEASTALTGVTGNYKFTLDYAAYTSQCLWSVHVL